MRFYEDLNHIQKNRLPQRAYYIPENEGAFCLLNGSWNFRYYSADYMEEKVIKKWDSIPVPSCWQLYGYENPNYSNVKYPYPVDFPYDGPLGGMQWQREIEEAAFKAGGRSYKAPAQRVGDFLAGVPSTGPGAVQPTYRPGVTWCDLHQVLPQGITNALKEALPLLDGSLKGFADADAVLIDLEPQAAVFVIFD